MQYRPDRLVKSYSRDLARDLAGQVRGLALRLFARLRAGLARLRDRAALRWAESMQRRYLARLGQDGARALALARPRAYVGFCLGLCGVMSLGFLVANPPSAAPSHQVRVDLSRPTVRAISPKEAAALKRSASAGLAAHDAPYGGGWFSSGRVSYGEAQSVAATAAAPAAEQAAPGAAAGWEASRSILGVEGGQVIMRTASGSKVIPRLGQIKFSENSTSRPRRGLAPFGAGTARPENLLAELTLQGLDARGLSRVLAPAASGPAPRWDGGNYGAGAFAQPSQHWSGLPLAQAGTERICPLNRMEQASWLNMLQASHTRGTIYRAREAGHYRPFVEHYATHYALQPSLVYAIMRVESGFNPLAISHANALGLMQVVPETAGNEVHAFLRGKKATPGAELLFAPESNIEYGTTYLHLLTTRHFGEVKNPLSRELCIIAAYNGGPGAVYRVFSRNRDKAVQQINKLTPEQLYARLLTGLSSQETREYLPKVLTARNQFLRGEAQTR